MEAFSCRHAKYKKLTLSCLLIFMHSSSGIKLGLFAGDYKRHSNPLLISKYSHHSPVFINLPAIKVPEIKPLSKLSPVHSALSRSLSRRSLPLLAPRLPLVPLIPPLPLLPILPPPILPIIPHFPLLPPVLLPPILPPVFPHLSPFSKLSSPLRHVSLLKKKTPLEKALEWKPFDSKKDGVLDKLLDLRKRGSLSTAEFIRFKKLLLKK